MAIKSQRLLGIGGLCLIGACSMGPKIKPDELAKVKQVAIVGFELVQQQPKDIEFSIGGSSNNDMPMMPMSRLPENSEHAKSIYELVRVSLQKDFGWKIPSHESLRKVEAYQSITKERTSGIRSLPPPPADSDVYSAEGIMDWWAWEQMPKDKRRATIAALNTDAVLVVRARSRLKEGFSFKKLYGGGNFHPQVSYELKLYGRDGEDVYWVDNQIQGAATEKNVSHFGGISKRAALDKLVVEAAGIAATHFKASQSGAKN